jgi:hypothetical protein
MMEKIASSETVVRTTAKRYHIQEDGILHSQRRENLKSYFIEYWFSFVKGQHS